MKIIRVLDSNASTLADFGYSWSKFNKFALQLLPYFGTFPPTRQFAFDEGTYEDN